MTGTTIYSLVELPLSVVKRTDLPCLEPARDAVKVERVVADTPGHRALLAGGRGLVSLALYTCRYITSNHTTAGSYHFGNSIYHTGVHTTRRMLSIVGE